MRRTLACSLLAVLTTAVLATPASAARSRCSESGDVCYGAIYRNGDVNLSISLMARYFSTYRLCVVPDGYAAGRECRQFTIHRTEAGAYGSTIRWSRHFTNEGGGKYYATWSAGGTRLGPRITFLR